MLPHNNGKTARVAFFARGSFAEQAVAAGADVVGGEELVFHCVADEGVEVVRITFPGDDADDYVERGGYMGPPFEELDEELQESFNMWLYDRHIDSTVAEYVQRAAAAKESREYCRWLDSIATFVNK